MVVVRILDNNNVEYGVEIYENNFDGEVEMHDTFHCIAEIDEDDPRDTIFGTNDEMVTVHINPAKFLAADIVDHIVSCHPWETYDDDLVRRCIADVLSEHVEEILSHVDECMNKYLCRDNLTIIGGEKMSCPHKCGDCEGHPDECFHGCEDCGYFDGGNCLHPLGHYGSTGGHCAIDCSEWDNGE